jgi:hypothetical protein
MAEPSESFSRQFFQQARAAKATFVRDLLFRQRRQFSAPAIALPINDSTFERRATRRALRQRFILHA